MHIICPHCTTTYAIELSTLGVAGRTVRCSRCREVWLARPEDVRNVYAMVPSMADGERHQSSTAGARDEPAAALVIQQAKTPMVESPSISAELPDEAGGEPSWVSIEATEIEPEAPAPLRERRRLKPRFSFRLPTVSLGTVCAGMAALVAALMIWRVDVVRLLPQTAGFYKLVGLDVNLRGLSIKDVKVLSENVDG